MEEECEEARLALITNLLANSTVVDYDGAVQVCSCECPDRPLGSLPYPALFGRRGLSFQIVCLHALHATCCALIDAHSSLQGGLACSSGCGYYQGVAMAI